MDNKKFTEEINKIAVEDIECSEILFKKKKFPQAVYYLQQAVEKAVKNLYCLEGMSQKDLKRKVGHASSIAFAISCLKDRKDLSNEQKNEIVKNWSNINPRRVFLLVPKESLLELVSGQEWQKRFDKWKPFKIGDVDYKFISSFGYSKRGNKQNKLLFLEPELFTLSMILEPHFESTRYPNDFFPFSNYYSKKGIIRIMPQLFKQVKKILYLLTEKVKNEQKSLIINSSSVPQSPSSQYSATLQKS